VLCLKLPLSVRDAVVCDDLACCFCILPAARSAWAQLRAERFTISPACA
jgi:hypothetical protein